MTYTESSALMQDSEFRGRIKVAALDYAKYIMDEDPKIPAHNTRMSWAKTCYLSPDAVATGLQPPTVMDPAVQTSGAAIDDAALSAAVQGVVNKMM